MAQMQTALSLGDAGPRYVALTKLSGEIARSLAPVGLIAVEGEVHNRRLSKSGRLFFTMKDRAAQIRVMAPPSRRVDCDEGQRVLVTGNLEWSHERGEVSLNAQAIDPVGEGAIAELIAKSRAELAADGTLDRPRRAIPRLPHCIGVVCGADAAVRHDIQSAIDARFAGYPVRFFETTVSGPTAEAGIIAAITSLDRDDAVDVIILARGGGDATQLLVWSDLGVCRAAAACTKPVVSAIGHEGDHPLVDEVADLRCGTPSFAAHAVVPDLAELRKCLDDRLVQLDTIVHRRLERAADRLSRIDRYGALRAGVGQAGARLQSVLARLTMVHPANRLALAFERLKRGDPSTAMYARLNTARGLLEVQHSRITGLGNRQVLDRGYAIARSAEGSVLRSADSVSIGDDLTVELAKGTVTVRVIDKKE